MGNPKPKPLDVELLRTLFEVRDDLLISKVERASGRSNIIPGHVIKPSKYVSIYGETFSYRRVVEAIVSGSGELPPKRRAAETAGVKEFKRGDRGGVWYQAYFYPPRGKPIKVSGKTKESVEQRLEALVQKHMIGDTND
jgi:hypothetical protein